MDDTTNLLQSFEDYQRLMSRYFPDSINTSVIEQNRSFLQFHPEAFNDAYFPGHFTGSALVASNDYKRVLLTHHKKLNLWLQLGGHADGEKNLSNVALREAREESGLQEFSFFRFPNEPGLIPFDLDIHAIPERKLIPGHSHYDVRYLLICEGDENFLAISEESHDVKWFTWEAAEALTREESMQRQFFKAKKLLGISAY